MKGDLERLARALARQGLKRRHIDPDGFSPSAPQISNVDVVWRDYVDDARALLTELLNPSEGMLEAAWSLTVAATPEERMMHELADKKSAFKSKARRRFTAMIAHVLADGGETP